VLGESFAKANDLKAGDSLVAVINGQRETLKICGIALSPEYVFEARAGETLPDHKRFSVIWMNYRALAVAYDMDGAFNDVVISKGERGGMIAHVDGTVICEAPKVGPHRDAIRAKLAEIIGVDVSRVAVKATTSEQLGFTGRREGIAAMALATVRLPA
jgi:hypothetical protein